MEEQNEKLAQFLVVSETKGAFFKSSIYGHKRINSKIHFKRLRKII
jgi:hypothetical protein